MRLVRRRPSVRLRVLVVEGVQRGSRGVPEGVSILIVALASAFRPLTSASSTLLFDPLFLFITVYFCLFLFIGCLFLFISVYWLFISVYRGNDSQRAVRDLLAEQLTSVRDVKGGFLAWRKEVDPTWPDY